VTSTRTRTIRRRIVIGWLPVLLLFVLGGSMAGCSGAATSATATGASPAPAAQSTAEAQAPAGGAPAAGHTMGHAIPASAEVDAAWAARPGYVLSADARTVEAYAYAIARPDVIDWMPCYCGCVAMDHRNNADCYLEPREEGAPVAFEEHASYCGICVDITLTAKSMMAEGKSLLQIRIAVDGEYGSTAPGTDTALPGG
jgi:hypothetical protein